MDWSDEVRLTRMQDSEAGLLCKIRLSFKGVFLGWRTDADDVFGEGWMARAERLQKLGVLKVDVGERSVRMTVVAPGDRKREHVRDAMRKCRARKTKGNGK